MSTTACVQPGARAASSTATATSAAARPALGHRGRPRPPAPRRRRTQRRAPAGRRRNGSVATAGGAGRRRRRPSTASRAVEPARRPPRSRLGAARARGGSRVTRRVGTSSTRLRGARLGAGLTSIPPVPAVDAAEAVLKDPMVPEDRRDLPVVRVRPSAAPATASPGAPRGSARPAATRSPSPPSSRPATWSAASTSSPAPSPTAASAGSTLARDRNVSDRWVVLKGLLNSGDPDALAAAIAEQQFLAQVEHPLIVEIYNFVTHEGAGYIVMEYVGGTSLKQMLKDRMRAAGGRYDPLPVDQAIAYIVEILPAFQYLHDLGLVYCDFKPDNLIQVGDAVKLIDLGGVRRLDDVDSAIYGTVGYQAPEVAARRPVGGLRHLHDRAHARRCSRWSSAATRAPTSPRCRRSTRRRCSGSTTRSTGCCSRPARPTRPTGSPRPTSCGCSCSACCARSSPRGRRGRGRATPRPPCSSTCPDGRRRLRWTGRTSRRLRTDDGDPQSRGCAPSASTTRCSGSPRSRRRRRTRPRCCWRTRPRGARGRAQPTCVDDAVRALLADDPWEWRAVWMSGLAALRRRRRAEAQGAFNAVYGQVPGELAPKLALAVRLRDRRRDRRGRGALRDLRPQRRHLHRAGGLRPGPDPLGPRRRRRALCRARPGARRPAARSR